MSDKQSLPRKPLVFRDAYQERFEYYDAKFDEMIREHKVLKFDGTELFIKGGTKQRIPVYCDCCELDWKTIFMYNGEYKSREESEWKSFRCFEIDIGFDCPSFRTPVFKLRVSYGEIRGLLPEEIYFRSDLQKHIEMVLDASRTFIE